MDTFQPRLIAARTAAERLGALREFHDFWIGPAPPQTAEEAQALVTTTLPVPLRLLYEFIGG